MSVEDRVTFNELRGSSDLTHGVVDEIVLSDARIHLEQLDHRCAHLRVSNGQRVVAADIRAERVGSRWELRVHVLEDSGGAS